MNNNQAYDEGYDAYWEGADVSDNPYDEEKDADARLAWEQGVQGPRTRLRRERGIKKGQLLAYASSTTFSSGLTISALILVLNSLRKPGNFSISRMNDSVSRVLMLRRGKSYKPCLL